MSKQVIEKNFPSLAKSGYSITSPETRKYNCIAWAAEDTERWWWPDPLNTDFWPPKIPRTEDIKAFIEAFKLLGYAICNNHKYENGFEKIAIYAHSDGTPTHAAKQLESGNWTSKLGPQEDIEHTNPDVIASTVYGSVVVIMKRPKSVKFNKFTDIFSIKIAQLSRKIFNYFLRKI